MKNTLLLRVYFHDARYHGAEDWPPAPARLFQALLSGSARGLELPQDCEAALEWLENLPAPIIIAPHHRRGQKFTNFVPNNDLDRFGGNPKNVNKIKTPKIIQPILLNTLSPVMFLWDFDDTPQSQNHAQKICDMSLQLYQLGQGIDMAWAQGEWITAQQKAHCLSSHPGVTYHPSRRGTAKNTLSLAQPMKGSLQILKVRHRGMRRRLSSIDQQKTQKKAFTQPPKPLFRPVLYNAKETYFLFEIRQSSSHSHDPFAGWPATQAAQLTTLIRNGVVKKLTKALPEKTHEIQRLIGGQGAMQADKSLRVKIIPLPSIGHPHADGMIRRILVQIPPNCPLRTDDLSWSFSGLKCTESKSHYGEQYLLKTTDKGMLRHYGFDSHEKGYRTWRTVTPVVLPQIKKKLLKGSNGPDHLSKKNSGSYRINRESLAQQATKEALRHLGITAPVQSIRTQREPFGHGRITADQYAHGTRFHARSLHHLEITFAKPVTDVFVLGNGRYVGLGLMAPYKEDFHDVLAFRISDQTKIAVRDRAAFLHAARRALMSLASDNRNKVDKLFSGHDRSAPARSGQHQHIFLTADNADGYVDRLIVSAPWACDRKAERPSQGELIHFDQVVRKLSHLLAGKLGIVKLGPAFPLCEKDPVIGPACRWKTHTFYHATRYAKRNQDLKTVVTQDIITECQRRGIAQPEVDVLQVSAGPRGGNLVARIGLQFKVIVQGPLILGRDSHRGGGLFVVDTQEGTMDE